MTQMVVTNRPLKLGHTLTITGIPKTDVQRFIMNIDSGDDIAFHMSVWWEGRSVGLDVDKMVVYNTYQGGAWGEDVKQFVSPFNQKELFKFTVTLTREEFLVILSDGSEIHLPNRLGASEYKDFSFDEGVLIRSFEIN